MYVSKSWSKWSAFRVTCVIDGLLNISVTWMKILVIHVISFLIEYQAIGLEISTCDKETICMVQLGKKDHSQVLDVTQCTTNSRTCNASKDYVRFMRSVISGSL